MPDTAYPVHRWGRVAAPAEDEGSYVYLEPVLDPPTAGAYRVWHHRPDVPDDDDANWTMWLDKPRMEEWFGPGGAYQVDWPAEHELPPWIGRAAVQFHTTRGGKRRARRLAVLALAATVVAVPVIRPPTAATAAGLALLAALGYWSLYRLALVLTIHEGVVQWEAAMSCGRIPIAEVASVRAARIGPATGRIGVIERRDGSRVRALTGEVTVWGEFVDTLSAVRPGLAVDSRWHRYLGAVRTGGGR